MIQRRALSHVGGTVEMHGETSAAEALAHALDVPTSLEAEEAARAHVHGFHSYPARMHPLTAARLVEALSQPGELVLDPFCGSGTVVVEARLVGRAVAGVDANPLATRLADLKARGVAEAERERLVEGARAVAAKADARRKAKAGASRRFGPEDVALFAPHVLLELDGLRIGLNELPDARTRSDLELVLSSMLTKVGRRASDTSEHQQERRIAAGYPSRFFVKKTEELTRRLAEVAERLLAAPSFSVRLGDARQLRAVTPGSVALVATSPPYPGNYDYLAHHAARLRWLGIDSKFLADAEIGARRHLEPLGVEQGRKRFETDLAQALDQIARALSPSGRAALLVADSVIAGGAVRALDLIETAAKPAGLSLVASASQARPHFHWPSQNAFAGAPRAEHLVLLGRSQKSTAASPGPVRNGDRAKRP